MTKIPAHDGKPTRVEITTRLGPDLHDRLREAAFYRRVPQNQIMVEALKMWLSANGKLKK